MVEADERAQALRVELKQWEKAFADANGGRKAERSDIKNEPVIAQKYKEYDKLRTRRSSKHGAAGATLENSRNASTKRKREGVDGARPAPSSPKNLPATSVSHHAPSTVASPSARSKPQPSTLDPYDSPRHSHLTPTALRTSIGPTPQRDGYALGLFDLLSPRKSPRSAQKPPAARAPSPTRLADVEATPRKRARPSPRSAAKSPPSASENAVVSTPLKGSATPAARHSRTPPSSSRRNFLDAFLMTPPARRLRPGLNARSMGLVRGGARDGDLDDVSTPSLKRSNDPRSTLFIVPEKDVEEKENGPSAEDSGPSISFSPMAVRLPPKPIGRPLSALVKGLREMEDERDDEDMDILREMEAEWGSAPAERAKPGAASVDGAQVVDRHREENNKATEKDGGDEKGDRRAWKKNGQKRTTRHVRIQPSTAKWKPEPEWKGGVESEEEIEAPDETKLSPKDEASVARLEHAEGDPTGKAASKHKDEKKKGPGRPRKTIAATAHPNFRALKIRNKNSKAKRGRFGRRR